MAAGQVRARAGDWRSPARGSATLAVAVAALGAVFAAPMPVTPAGFCQPYVTGPAGLTVALDTPAGGAQPVAVTWQDKTPATAAAPLPQFHTYPAAGGYGVQAVDETGSLVAAGRVLAGTADPAPYAFAATPIAAGGSLRPGETVPLTLTLTGPDGTVPAACGDGTDAAFAWLSFKSVGGSATAQVSGTSAMVRLGPAAELFQGDASGHIAISYTAPAGTAAAGLDTITAANLPAAATATASDSYQHQPLGRSSPTAAQPAIGSLAVSPRRLPRRGGAVQVSWTARNASTCSLTASRAGHTLSSLQGIPCSAGAVTRRLSFPPDRRHRRQTYRLTVTAIGAAGTTPATAQATVRVRGHGGRPARPQRGSQPPVLLLLLIGLIAAAGAAGLLGRHYYRRSRGPTAPEQVNAVPHAGPPGGVTVRRAGPGASLVVRVEPHHDAGRMVVHVAGPAARDDASGPGIRDAGGAPGEDARALAFADADTIAFAAADSIALAAADSVAPAAADSVAPAAADSVAPAAADNIAPAAAGTIAIQEAGLTIGHDAGLATGHDAGFTAGHDVGLTASHDAGLTASLTASHDAGLTAGHDVGLTDAGLTASQQERP